MIQQNFENILNSVEGTAFLLNLPFEQMRNICESNSLNITNEMLLVQLFEKYLNHREKLPLLPEEDPALDWSHLNADERKAREDAKAAADAEAATKK